MIVNPNAVVLVAFCTVVGFLLGSWAIGLAAGLGLVLLASWRPDDALWRYRRRRRRR